MTPPSAGSTAEIVIDDRGYAAWAHVVLDRTVNERSFGAKDVIDVSGMPTACGFEPWRDRIADADATVVQRLRAAGWDPVGKTHTAQFAYADPPPTLNPTDPSRTPGGSSTGSAVAVARGHVPMALGTQTGGSTIRPAAYCGVVGMKPSFGIVPVDGIRPVAPSLDTIGIIATTVSVTTEVAHATGAIDDAGFQAAIDGPVPDSISMFGDVRSLLQDASANSAWQRVASSLVEGFEPRTRPLPELDLARAVELHSKLMAVGAWPVHADTFASPEGKYYGPKLRKLLELGRDLSETTQASDHREALRSVLPGLEDAVPEDGVLLMPATIGSPPERVETGSSRLCMPWTVLGFPVVVVPWRLALDTGETEGGGVQVIGQHGEDAMVLRLAAILESKLLSAGLHPQADDV